MGHDSRRNAAKFTAGCVSLLITVGASGCSRPTGRHQASFTHGSSRIDVDVPGPAGTPRITALPPLRPGDIPAAMKVLTQPVHIATRPFSGQGTLTFSYSPQALPAGARADRDLSILEYVPSVSAWLPAGGTVNTRAHTVTVSTAHFSDWALAVTDPQELADEEATDHALSRTLGGKLGELITGKQDSLDCSAGNLLLAARISEPAALSTQLCEEVLPGGSYRLQYVNTSGTPQLIHLPDGFTEHDSSLEVDPLLGRLLTGDDSRSAVVEAGGSLDLRFTGQAVTSSTRIAGDTDWAVYVVTTIRTALEAVLGVKSGDSKLVTKLDQALNVADLWDCAARAQQGISAAATAGGKLAAIRAQVYECGKDVAAEHAARLIGALAGVGETAVERFLTGKLDPLLALPKLLELARDEVAGLPPLLFSAGGGHVDTSVTIIPVRAMNFAEASALPAATLGSFGQCPAPPADVPLPAGAPPAIQCLFAVPADLDGNGKPDRLLLWMTPPADSQDLSSAGQDGGGPQIGAVAYLDDGSFHLLEESPASWQLLPFLSVEQFYPAQVVSFGDDRRQQVLVTVTVGANTTWQVVLTVGADRRLHVLKAADGTTVALAGGGGAGSSSGYGCVERHGQPLVAYEGSLTNRSPDGLNQSYSWTTDYYQLHDLRWTRVATAAGRTPGNQWTGLHVGSRCSNPNPSNRGPAIGNP